MIEGTIKDAETWNHLIPVPIVDGKYQYMARATLCYFPKCNKNQGVDYTDTELNFYFGRMEEKSKKDAEGRNMIGIRPLNRDEQDDPDARTFEEEARKQYRKWDNVKHLSDVAKSCFRAKKVLGQPYWGFKIRSISRTGNREPGLRFGMVVTLLDKTGRNRIGEFVQSCASVAEPWVVNEIDMQVNAEVYKQADADIDFDDDNDDGEAATGSFGGSENW